MLKEAIRIAVTDRTIYTDMYDEIKAILVANSISHSPVITGSNADGTFTKPTVAIHPLDKDEENVFFGDSEGKKILNVVIDCLGSTGRDSKEIMQDVEYYLKNTKIQGIRLTSMTSNYSFDLVSDTKMKMQSSTFTYLRG